jgi:hypothetical protein
MLQVDQLLPPLLNYVSVDAIPGEIKNVGRKKVIQCSKKRNPTGSSVLIDASESSGGKV